MEELRDIHRLEAKSLTDQIDKLKGQLEEAEKLLNASQSSTTQVEQESATRKAEIDRLQGELDKATNHAKEEEEKRSPSYSPPLSLTMFSNSCHSQSTLLASKITP